MIEIIPSIHIEEEERITTMNTHRWFRDILLFGYENGSVIMKQFEDKDGLNLVGMKRGLD